MDPAFREMVQRRAADRCEYCRLPQSAVPLRFHVEHIIARQHGGASQPDNLALACDRCNLHKGTNLSSIDPETGEAARLFNPRSDNWADHFALDGAYVVGRTKVGRTTALLLRMNADKRVELRRHLLLVGEF